MGKKRNTARILEIITVAAVIILTVSNVIFWASQKEGFHVDEMFSYEQVGNTEYSKPEFDRPEEPCLNFWHSRAYYEDFLKISGDELFNISGFYESAYKNGAHPPLYLVLLGMVISLVSPDHFSKWSGIVLNIVFFILTLLTLYDLAKRVFGKKKTACLAVLLSGLSVGVVSIAVFIRVYMMLTFFTVAWVDLHIRMMECEQKLIETPKKRVLCYIQLALTFIFGSLSHYYFLIFAFFVSFWYWIILLIVKERRLLIEFTLVLLGSFTVFLLLCPKVLNDLFLGVRGVEAINNFWETESGYAQEVVHYFREIDKQTTGGFFAFLVLAALFVFFVKQMKALSLSLRLGKTDHIQIRYSCPRKAAVPEETREISIPMEWVMVLLIAISSICYVLLIAKIAPTLYGEPLKTTRYIACVFPCAVILVVFCIDRVLLRLFPFQVLRKIAWPLLVLMVSAGYLTSGVMYLYPGTQEQLEQLSLYSVDRAVMVTEAPYNISNLNVYFTIHKATYQTNQAGLSDISATFADIPDEEIVVYISIETEDTTVVLSTLLHQINVKECRYLFQTTGSNQTDVYLLKR